MKSSTPNPLERRVYSEFGVDATQRPATARPEVPPAQQQVKVQASRKGRKGKTVTVISGIQGSEAALAELAKKLKGHCGAGGAVKDGTIEVQGDHCEKVHQYLIGFGYKAKISGG
ncbi:MAG: translation initiation factor [Thermosynechococcaceae cyanobacterium MS004]|nr:translation initiation factor [Thermosynechococcaceae cyanobacterium MS004]